MHSNRQRRDRCHFPPPPAFLSFSFHLSKRGRKNEKKNESTHRPPIRCAPWWWTAATREERQHSLQRLPVGVLVFYFWWKRVRGRRGRKREERKSASPPLAACCSIDQKALRQTNINCRAQRARSGACFASFLPRNGGLRCPQRVREGEQAARSVSRGLASAPDLVSGGGAS